VLVAEQERDADETLTVARELRSSRMSEVVVAEVLHLVIGQTCTPGRAAQHGEMSVLVEDRALGGRHAVKHGARAFGQG
jgi:hypothetical protein